MISGRYQLPLRYLSLLIKEDLEEKMVFLGGPRQVGKTTLAQKMIKNYQDQHPAYLNYDFDDHRLKILKKEWPLDQKLIVLDEIHKFKSWRNLIKGFYDTFKNTHQFLITGSARLDHYWKGGDSLLGRYYYYRLHPYSLPELGYSYENLQSLFIFGGFPEPLAKKSLRTLKRWHSGRLSKIVRMDLRDLENVKDIDKIELLARELVNRIGSPLSVKSLSEDLSVDPKTAKKWIEILSSLYYCFQIPPFGSPRIRAVKKEQKLYLWDWSQIEDEGIKFENMVAGHLLKFCHYHEDANGELMELRYIRDTDKREVDFIVLKNKKPLFAVECKLKNKGLSPHIHYFNERCKIPKFYQVHMEETGERQISEKVAIVPFLNFCQYEKLV